MYDNILKNKVVYASFLMVCCLSVALSHAQEPRKILSRPSAHPDRVFKLLKAPPPPPSFRPTLPPEARHPVYIDFSVRPGSGRTIGGTSVFVPLKQTESQMTFADIQGMVDSKSNKEGNFMFGHRHILKNVVVGGWVGFDFRKTAQGNEFKQGAAGIEIMSKWFDWRLNAYIPEGKKVYSGTPFQRLSFMGGNTLSIVSSGGQKVELAMPGFDSEVGFKIPTPRMPKLDLRVYGGGFLFSRADAPTVAGPKARFEARFDDTILPGARLTLGGEVSYDKVRGSQTFAFIGLRIPLQVSKKSASTPTGLQARLGERIVRDVDVITPKNQLPKHLGVDEDGQAIHRIIPTQTRVFVVDRNATPSPQSTCTLNDPGNSVAQALEAGALTQPHDILYIRSGVHTVAANAADSYALTTAAPTQRILGGEAGLTFRNQVINGHTIQQQIFIAPSTQPTEIRSTRGGFADLSEGGEMRAIRVLDENPETAPASVVPAMNIDLSAIPAQQGFRHVTLRDVSLQRNAAESGDGIFLTYHGTEPHQVHFSNVQVTGFRRTAPTEYLYGRGLQVVPGAGSLEINGGTFNGNDVGAEVAPFPISLSPPGRVGSGDLFTIAINRSLATNVSSFSQNSRDGLLVQGDPSGRIGMSLQHIVAHSNGGRGILMGNVQFEGMNVQTTQNGREGIVYCPGLGSTEPVTRTHFVLRGSVIENNGSSGLVMDFSPGDRGAETGPGIVYQAPVVPGPLEIQNTLVRGNNRILSAWGQSPFSLTRSSYHPFHSGGVVLKSGCTPVGTPRRISLTLQGNQFVNNTNANLWVQNGIVSRYDIATGSIVYSAQDVGTEVIVQEHNDTFLHETGSPLQDSLYAGVRMTNMSQGPGQIIRYQIQGDTSFQGRGMNSGEVGVMADQWDHLGRVPGGPGTIEVTVRGEGNRMDGWGTLFRGESTDGVSTHIETEYGVFPIDSSMSLLDFQRGGWASPVLFMPQNTSARTVVED